jgi:Lar family restriction alleviation protein
VAERNPMTEKTEQNESPQAGCAPAACSASPDYTEDQLKTKPLTGLAPCPFCGGEHIGIINGTNRVFVLCCEKSECTAQIWGKTESDAIAKWNSRSTPNDQAHPTAAGGTGGAQKGQPK